MNTWIHYQVWLWCENEINKRWGILKNMCWFIMIWWSSKREETNSIFAPSVVFLPLMYRFLDFIFTSPSTTTKSELDSARLSRVSSKLIVNFSKSSHVWLGDRWREANVHISEPTCNSKLNFLVSNEYLIFSVEGNFWNR